MCVILITYSAYVCLSPCIFCFFFFKQKTAYEMRISDWSSDVCSSDLHADLLQLVDDFDRISPVDVGEGVISARPALGIEGVEQERLQIGRASCRERVCQYV